MVAAARQTDDDFPVWDDNWQVVDLFLKLQTQWVVTMGGVVGLNYGSVDFCLKIYGIEDKREIFEGLRVMEMAALQILNERKGEKNGD